MGAAQNAVKKNSLLLISEEEAKKPQLGQPIETNEIAVTKDKEQSYDSEGLFGIDSNEDVDEDDDAESEQPEDTHSLG